MQINRRGFLFGTAATLATIAVAEIAPYVEPITFHGAGYKKRVLSGVRLMGLGNGEEPIHVSLKRWPLNTSLFNISIHPRSSYSWWPAPGNELVFIDKSLMLIEATGCPSKIEIVGHDDGVWFLESYSFPSGNKERWLMS